jgi:4-hydroxy-2-oxoheptanedioate aldolase
VKTSLKARLAAGEPVMGTLAFLSSADVIEVLAVAGFDYVIIDLEHSPTNPETALHMVRAAQVRGMSPLVRVRDNEEKLILQALEIGAEGICIPFVQSAADVRRAAAAIRFAPEGVRGTCTAARAAMYGTLRRQFLEHTRRTNGEIALIGLIEDMRGVTAIDEILACDPGLDAVLVGRSDLSASVGRMGEWNNPEVLEATRHVIGAVGRQKRVQAGMVLGMAEDTAKWVEAGCRFIAYGTDIDLLMHAASQARQSFLATNTGKRKHG